jgi:hypothetical protein
MESAEGANAASIALFARAHIHEGIEGRRER